MESYLGWLLTLALLGGAKVCVAGPPLSPPGSALRDQVAAAVARDLESRFAVAPDPGDLRILDSRLSVPSNSELHVASVRVGNSPGSWMLRMECASRRDCLPFHVVLRMPVAGPREDLSARRRTSASELLQPAVRKTNPKQLRSPVARSGDHVLLVEERSGLRIKVTAVCLESGGLGDQIRVRNLASKRVLLAMVAGKDLVRVE